MKILVITPYYIPNIVGGAEISSQLLAESMNKFFNFDVEVLTLGFGPDREENGIKIRSIESNEILMKDWKSVLLNDDSKKNRLLLMRYSLFSNKELVLKYDEFFQTNSYDCVIINSNEEAFGRASLWKSLSKLKAKKILTFRDPFLLGKKNLPSFANKILISFIKRQLSFINHYVAPSSYMMKMYNNAGYRNVNQTVVFNAVDAKMKYYPCKGDSVLYVGSINEEKGVRTLVKAVEELRKKGRKCCLNIIGKGPLLNEIKNSDVVSYLGS